MEIVTSLTLVYISIAHIKAQIIVPLESIVEKKRKIKTFHFLLIRVLLFVLYSKMIFLTLFPFLFSTFQSVIINDASREFPRSKFLEISL